MHTLTRLGLTRGFPSLNRTSAVAMAILQAVTLTLLMDPVIQPVLVVALAGWMAPQMKLLLPIPTSIGLSLILIGSVIFHQIREEEFLAMGFIGSKMAFEVSCCCLACQLFLMFVRKYAERLPVWYLALSGTSMVFAGDIRVTYQNSNIMLWIMMAYLICWSGFAISFRTPAGVIQKRQWVRRTILGALLILSVVGGRMLALVYLRYANRLEFWVTEYLYQGRIIHYGNGFSGRGGLNDITEMKEGNTGNEEALRIQAPFYPDYLRGCVFTEFAKQSWTASIPGEVISPLSDRAPLRASHPNESVFLLTKHWPEVSAPMAVWPVESRSVAHFFLPLGAAVLSCDGNSIKKDQSAIVERDSKPMLDSYLVLVASPDPVPPEEVDPAFLQLPDHLSPVVDETAEAIFQNAESTQDKIRAVESFFHNNFTYSLSLKIPRGVDRLMYFLTRRPPAHCEYFATATTLLLRKAHVPARYVTGYVVSGRNPLDGTYFALRRDAHAWVEAYDADQQRWVIVESTPVSGIPGRNQLNTFESARNASWGLLLKLLELARSGVVASLLRDYGGMILLLLPIPLAIVFGAQLYLKKIDFRWSRESRIRPEFASLARERISLDRFLARRGLPRPSGESLLQFAHRLETSPRLSTAAPLADWYRNYAELRYQDRPLDPEAVSRIRDLRRELIRTTKVIQS